MQKILYIALIALAATVLGNSASQAQDSPPSDSIKLAGLHLGMSPESALSTLQSMGYLPIDDPYDRGLYNDKYNVTYEAVVADTRATGIYNNYSVSGAKKSVLAAATRVRPETDETIQLSFSGFPSGQKLILITYTNSSATLTAEAFSARVAERYGAPNGRTGWSGKPQWFYGNVVVDGVATSDFLTMENRVGLPRRILSLQRKIDAQSYVDLIRTLALEGTSPSETTF